MKMNESSFFSDPKVMLSLLALLVSFVALIWTLANQAEQNRRWEKLNAANPEVKEIKMVSYKEVSKDEAMNTNWGYDPLIYAKGEATNIFYLPYFLSLYDSTTNEKIAKANPVFTFSEIEAELKRIGHSNKIKVFKHFRPKFVIENVGKTSAENLSIQIDAKIPGQEWQPAFTSNAQITLSGGQVSTIFFDIDLPHNFPLSEQISFKITFSWIDIHLKNLSKIINTKWTTNDNFWSYESGE
jgi:hypothetical protein